LGKEVESIGRRTEPRHKGYRRVQFERLFQEYLSDYSKEYLNAASPAASSQPRSRAEGKGGDYA
jgi:hypothetical protein